MFIYTTNTLINSATDPSFKDGKRFEADTTNKVLRVAREFKFPKTAVTSIYKRAHQDPKYFDVSFDLSKLDASKSQYGRIQIYIRLSGSNNSYYANDFVFNGKPFTIEFPIAATAAETVKNVIKIAKKYQIMVYENELFDITAGIAVEGVTTDGPGFLHIKGNDEYQVIQEAELQAYNDSKLTYDSVIKFGGWDDTAAGVVVTQGKAGFGTYRQLIKDMRLPTAANTRWIALMQDEKPIVGATYDEYIINMCVDRGIMGGDAVGQPVQSSTSHVFYVKSDLVTGWEKAITDAGLTITETVDKDSDDVALTADQLNVSEVADITTSENTSHGTKKTNTKA